MTGPWLRRAAYGALLGAFVGAFVAIACVVLGRPLLDGAVGAVVEYSLALVIASGVPLSGLIAGRGLLRPVWPGLALGALVVFVARRWGTIWFDAVALGGGSGPVGQVALAVFPLVGALIGVASEVDGATPRG